MLLLGEQRGAGVEGAPRGIERVALAAAVPAGDLLDAAAALVQSIAGQAHDLERVHHRDRVGQFLAGGGLEPGEPAHRNHPMPSSAHRSARRDSFARGSAARLVSWRDTCPQPVQR